MWNLTWVHWWRHRSGQNQNVQLFGLGGMGHSGLCDNFNVKRKQSLWIGMDSATDICKYHSLWFVTIIQVKVILGHQVKKDKQKNRDLELRHMFLGQIFAKNAKNDPKHFLKRQNRSKNKIRKITVKSRNDVKNAYFWHVLCYISAIFEDIDLKFCTHIHETLPSNICYGFLKILIWWETVLKRKKKMDIFLEIFRNFENFENPR